MSLLRGFQTAVAVLTGNPLVLPEVPEVYAPTAPLDLTKVAAYAELDFATLVKQGRARCIEWHVVQGVEVGFDHDLMVWCAAPGRFHEPEGV